MRPKRIQKASINKIIAEYSHLDQQLQYQFRIHLSKLSLPSLRSRELLARFIRKQPENKLDKFTRKIFFFSNHRARMTQSGGSIKIFN